MYILNNRKAQETVPFSKERKVEIKCGTDIIEIERIQKAIEHMGEKFLQTIFTEQEIKYCESKKLQKYQHYAARFAVKEAAFKAIGDRMNHHEMNWKKFEVTKSEKGKPILKVNESIESLQSLDISISHCKQYATANVVAIFE